MKFTFCIILFLLAGHIQAEEIKFKSPDLQKLHAVVQHIKAVPLLNMEICKLKLGKEVIPADAPIVVPEDENDELIAKLKAQVSEKENVAISNVHTLSELFNNTNFSSFSGVLDNTFCFVNLPQDQIGAYEDRVKLFNAIKEVSANINFAVLLDDGLDQGTNVTKLYVYGIDANSNEAYAPV